MSERDQWERLEKLYATLPESELVRLHQQRDELTQVAQDVLAAEFRARKIVPPQYEDEVSAAGPDLDDSVVSLWSFTDALAASEALSTLAGAEIEAQLVPGKTRKRSDGTDVVVWELMVPKAEEQRSVALLRRHRGLFPASEQVEGYASGSSNEADYITVAMFDDPKHVELAENALRAAGVPFLSTQEETEDGTVLLLQVSQEELDRAADVIEPVLPQIGETSEA